MSEVEAINEGERASMRVGRSLQSGIPLAALLLLTALALGAGALTVPSIVLEDGSSLTLANDTLVVNAALGGNHAGEIFVANGSSLTLHNVTVLFANTTDTGGIYVEGGSTLVIDASQVSANSSATFGIGVASSGVLRLSNARVTSLQILADFAAPAVLVRTGGEIHATDSQLRAHPDLRPLLDADAATLEFTRCELNGSITVVRSTATFLESTLTSLGDVTALVAAGSSVLFDNSTVFASGGASGIAAQDNADVTVRATNVTAEDLGVSVVRSSTVTLDGTIILDAAFGLVADGGVFVGSNVGVYGASTSLWLKNAQATLSSAQFGSGLLRLSASMATVGISGPLLGLVVAEDSSVLRLGDATFAWSQFAVFGGSFVIPEYTAVYVFHEANGSAVAPGVNWSVFAPGGSLKGRGLSGIDGASVGPALEGPSFDGHNFSQAPWYRLEFGRGTTVFTTTITAWGPSLLFDFFLDTTIIDLTFGGEGLLLSDRSPAAGSNVSASALLGFAEGGFPQSREVTFWIDGVLQGQRSVTLDPGPFVNVTFEFAVLPGTHLVEMAVDHPDSGGRGSLPERSEWANNYVAVWFNTSANQTVSVRPDLVVSGFWFEFVPTTVRDPVTGEALEAQQLVIHVNVSNVGLTAAGVFDMSVAAGINTSRVRLPATSAGSTTESNVTFGPYSRSEVIPVRVVLDVDDRVDEGNESNNIGDGSATIVIPPLPPPVRPIWATVLVIAAAAAIVVLSLWGVRSAFRPEADDALPSRENDSTKLSAAEAPSTPAPPALPPAPPVSIPGPSSSASAELPSSTTVGPPAVRPPGPPPPGAYPPYGYAPQPYMGVPYPMAPPQAQPPPPAGPPPPPGSSKAPPARCPNCGSSQVSYVFYPVRQVVCTACQRATLY